MPRLEVAQELHSIWSMGGNRMARVAKFAAAGLAATALGLAVAACQPQMMVPRALDAADLGMLQGGRWASNSATSNPDMAGSTVAEVQELVAEKAILVRDENRKVSRAEYFSPDGSTSLASAICMLRSRAWSCPELRLDVTRSDGTVRRLFGHRIVVYCPFATVCRPTCPLDWGDAASDATPTFFVSARSTTASVRRGAYRSRLWRARRGHGGWRCFPRIASCRR